MLSSFLGFLTFSYSFVTINTAFKKEIKKMSRFCTNCGKQANPGERFCSNCGNGLAQPVPAQPAPAQPAPVYTPAPKSKKPLIISLCAGGAALVLVLVLVLVFALGDPYEKAVKRFENVLNGDMEQVELLAPNAYWRGDRSEAKLAAYQLHYKMQQEYGPDARYTIEILSATELDQTALMTYASEWVSEYYGDPTEIQEGYLLTGSNQLMANGVLIESHVSTIVALKIEDEWYLTNQGQLHFAAELFNIKNVPIH